jgi:hypothetical protein
MHYGGMAANRPHFIAQHPHEGYTGNQKQQYMQSGTRVSLNSADPEILRLNPRGILILSRRVILRHDRERDKSADRGSCKRIIRRDIRVDFSQPTASSLGEVLEDPDTIVQRELRELSKPC